MNNCQEETFYNIQVVLMLPDTETITNSFVLALQRFSYISHKPMRTCLLSPAEPPISEQRHGPHVDLTEATRGVFTDLEVQD